MFKGPVPTHPLRVGRVTISKDAREENFLNTRRWAWRSKIVGNKRDEIRKERCFGRRERNIPMSLHYFMINIMRWKLLSSHTLFEPHICQKVRMIGVSTLCGWSCGTRAWKRFYLLFHQEGSDVTEFVHLFPSKPYICTWLPVIFLIMFELLLLYSFLCQYQTWFFSS